jgi:hypothetical protein
VDVSMEVKYVKILTTLFQLQRIVELNEVMMTSKKVTILKETL